MTTIKVTRTAGHEDPEELFSKSFNEKDATAANKARKEAAAFAQTYKDAASRPPAYRIDTTETLAKGETK